MTDIEKQIKELADTIRKQMEGGKLYGHPLDLTNLDHVIVAAYCVGQWAEIMRDHEILVGREKP